jgi:preprotein translocase subunit SecA
MRPLFAALGLRVGAVTESERDPARRRAAYACDVTYATSKAVAFDYLRDGLERRRRPAGLSGAAASELLLRGLCFAIVDEADAVLIDEACTPLVLASRGGGPAHERLHREAVEMAQVLAADRDFRCDAQRRRVALSEAGRARVAELAAGRGGFWSGPRRREEWITRALAALHVHRRDRDYLVRDGRVEIIDAPSGRVAKDRAWEAGLHQLIEAKEGCAISPPQETRARISYQRFFRRYLRLAGTTGTAREVGAELWSVYGLATVRIPARLPVRRRSLGVRVVSTETQKWDAVAERVRALREQGRPVLVGTASVAASEALAARLARAGIPHRVLNARQDAGEATLVAGAGEARRITVSTSMAGRGTDIRLGAGVEAAGGLHVVATQRAVARRIDRQLRGRCARQGEPGSCETVLSLEDEPLVRGVPRPVLRVAETLLRAHEPSGARLANLLSLLVQRAEEMRAARVRRGLAAIDDVRDTLLAFAGPPE